MTNTIHETITFSASPEVLYQALTDSDQFSKLTGDAPADIHAEEGGAFSCFGGMIEGRIIELIPNQRIVQAWRAANWDPGVYSVAKFEFTQSENQTHLVFDHTGFPEGQADHLKVGWEENYWKALRELDQQ